VKKEKREVSKEKKATGLLQKNCRVYFLRKSARSAGDKIQVTMK